MKGFLKHIVFLVILLTLVLGAEAQLYHAINDYSLTRNKSLIIAPSSRMHSSIQPYYLADIELRLDELDIPKDLIPLSLHAEWDTVFTHLNDLRFDAKPLFGLGTQAQNNTLLYGAGVWFGADYKSKLAIEYSLYYQKTPFNRNTGFIENSLWNSSLLVNPNYADSIGIFQDFHLTYKPYRFLVFETGFGNHFIGDGYRSMMLSANVYNYPYIKTELEFWHIHYTFLILQAKDLNVPGANKWGEYTSKYSAIHYFNWHVNKHLSFGLFEAVIMGPDHGFEIQYLNPSIFFRPVEFSLGSSDNALLGLNTKITISDKFHFYGQLVLDDFNVSKFKSDVKHLIYPDSTGFEYGFFGNKYSLQAGFKTYDFFHIKNLNWFVEYNYSRPYCYSHHDSEQNYSHYGRAFAHPLGANFVEWVSGIDYMHKRLQTSIRLIYARTGTDTTGTHFGQDIFKPTMDALQNGNIPVNTYFNETLQGVLNTVTLLDIEVYYNLNPSSGLKVGGGFTLGEHQVEGLPIENILQWRVGLTASLNRNYNGF